MTDDELFQALSQALSPAPPQPSPAAVLALRRAVIEARPARSAPPWWRRRLLAVTVTIPMVLGGSTAAYALTGAALPEPVRAAAHAVGLPVDSVAVADTRAAAAKLKDGLRKRDQAAVDEAARRLRDRLSHLDAGDRHRVEPQADALLGDANQFDAQNTPANQAGPGDPNSPPAPSGHDSNGGQGPPGAGTGSRYSGGDRTPPGARTGGQDSSGGQGSPPPTGFGPQGGNLQDNSSVTATGAQE